MCVGTWFHCVHTEVKDNQQESIFSFYCGFLGTELRLATLGNKPLYPLSHLELICLFPSPPSPMASLTKVRSDVLKSCKILWMCKHLCVTLVTYYCGK